MAYVSAINKLKESPGCCGHPGLVQFHNTRKTINKKINKESVQNMRIEKRLRKSYCTNALMYTKLFLFFELVKASKKYCAHTEN